MKGVNVIKKLSNVHPRHSLATIYISFVQLHLDYEVIIYDKPNNDKICQNIESMHYNAALAITDPIKGTSRTKRTRSGIS